MKKKKNTGQLTEMTDNECAKLLNETMHRMDFLVPLYNEVYRFAYNSILKMLQAHINQHTFLTSFENQYFDMLKLKINISQIWGQDDSENGGMYENYDELVNGKIPLPIITINITPNIGGTIDKDTLRSTVEHELTHLYDDWIWQKSGHEPLLKTKKRSSNKEYIDNVLDNVEGYESDVYKCFAYCVYISDYAEENAFLNQSIAELKKLGANRGNVHDVMKKTTAYQTYRLTYEQTKEVLENCSEEEVDSAYQALVQKYGQISLPKKKNGVSYKQTFLMWVENILKGFIKRYSSIVQYYIDNLENGGQSTNTKKNY